MPDSDHAEPELIDLHHLGRARVIGAWRVDGVVVDPGPSSCLARLLPLLEADPPRALALTHIHLDHAGSAGSLARRFPDMEVWVHERGAPHLVDPARLLASAGRLYGKDMQRLWGEVLPVPAERVRVLRGDERVGSFRVTYTPGHASHHVAYLHEPSGWAFAGDVAGVRIAAGPVIAPTPPPDIDLVAWRASLGKLQAWRPRRLALTHFGARADVAEHLDALREQLERVELLARELDQAGFLAALRASVAHSRASAEDARAYEQALQPAHNYLGLVRYLGGGAGPAA